MLSDATALFIAPVSAIREAIACIDRNAEGIALVVDRERRLLATLTDGDIRRAMLRGIDLDSAVQTLLDHREPTVHPSPLTAPVGTSDSELLRMMNEYAIRHVPLVNQAGQVADIVLLSELVREYEMPIGAVVMAGGYGTRLRPLTEDLPKPMLPIGGRPLLELIVEQLRDAGIRRVNLTTHYKRDLIAKHFRDGRDIGVEIRYVEEDRPLGTAGALSLLELCNEPLLVMNGDILTGVNFQAMLDFHRQHRADMTVAVKEYECRLPYGVIEIDGVVITGISEKPVLRQFINAGIYLLNPDVREFIPYGEQYDMPDLISRLVAEGRRVVSFPVREYWLDIGRDADYKEALEHAKAGARQP